MRIPLPLPSSLSTNASASHLHPPIQEISHLPHPAGGRCKKSSDHAAGVKAILPENGRGLWGSGALGLWGVIFFFDDCVFDLHAVMFGISFGGLIILYLCLCHVFILIQLALFLLEFLRTFHF